MKTLKILVLFTMAFGAFFARASDIETWTSAAGTTVQAAFVRLTDENIVVLRSAEGEELQIPLQALDDEGQAQVRERAQAAREERLAEARAQTRRLQVILPEAYQPGDNEIIGRVDSALMTAILYAPSGELHVFVKENGEYLSPPIRLRFHVRYRDEDARRSRNRRVERFEEPPAMENNVAHFRMHMEKGVYAELRYELRDDGVDIGFMIEDPDNIDTPSRSRMRAHFPAVFYQDPEAVPPVFYSPRFPDGTGRETFMGAIEEWEVRYGGLGRGRGTVRPFHVPDSIGSGDWFEIGGGVYGPHTVRIERPRRGGSLSGWLYRDNMPAQGFLIHLRKDELTSPADRPADLFRLTIQ